MYFFDLSLVTHYNVLIISSFENLIHFKCAQSSGEVETSPCKVTSFDDNEVIVRIGAKRRRLFCEDQTVLEGLASGGIPVSGTVKFQSDTLVSFEPNQDK